jgi:anti-sigma regulatory factor (Ser/Thr protein kinase)
MEVQPVQPLDLDLPLSVSPAMVSPTRRIIEAKLGLALDDEDAIFRVAMTAHELLENAAKYASDGKARLEVRVSPREEDAVVRVVVTNNSTPDHIRQLEICYAEMKSMPDAMAHYFALMRQNAKIGAVSRLGLARVRAEGEMELDVAIDGPAVKIVASGIVVRP